MKVCTRCKVSKSLDEFYDKVKGQPLKHPRCKSCLREVSNVIRTSNVAKVIFNNAKYRSKKYSLDFNITLEDIIIPEFCPVLGVRLQYASGYNAPSLDRIDPNRGYVKGNVQIISFKANTIKSNASFEEIEKVYLHMKILPRF